MKRLYFFLTMFIIASVCNAQITYDLDEFQDGEIIFLTDYTEFFDSGGSFGNYSNNEDYTVTICPDDNFCDQQMILYFDEFDIEGNEINNDCSYDYLNLEGSSFSSTTYCNVAPPPFTAGDPLIINGCIDLTFHSDSEIVESGFRMVCTQKRFIPNIETLSCGDSYDGDIIVPSFGCFECQNDFYPCGSGNSELNGYEENFWLSSTITGQVSIEITGDVSVFLVQDVFTEGCWDYEIISCAQGGQLLTYNSDLYTDEYLIVDAQGFSVIPYTLTVNCGATDCGDLRWISCSDVIFDDNFNSQNNWTEHYNCDNNDGCRTTNELNNNFNSPDNTYDISGLTGNVTFDLKSNDPSLDLDLFIYDDCESDVIFDKSALRCDYQSVNPAGEVDAVFIEDIQNTGLLRAVVDGYSNENTGVINIGSYTLAATCGSLCWHDSEEILCGQTKSDNNGFYDNYASYYCGEDENDKGGNWGKEKVYHFDLVDPASVVINLDILENKDLNLYLLSDCESTERIAHSKRKGSLSEVIVSDLAPGRYYIVVEGYCGDESDFILELDGCGDEEDCLDCSYCFDYYSYDDIYYFEPNHCDDSPATFSKRMEYDWEFPAGSVAEYLEGTSATSARPICRFNPGFHKICYSVWIGEFQYTCCLYIYVPVTPCSPIPPTCGLSFENQGGGFFNFDAGESTNGESYTWLVERSGTHEIIDVDLGDLDQQQINLAPYGFGCYLVTCYVTNCYGTSKVTLKVCYNSSDCTEDPPSIPHVVPFTDDNNLLTFEGIEGTWDSYEWMIPEDITLNSGSLTSSNISCFLPPLKRYRFCLILRRGCYTICYCWTVGRGCCNNNSCNKRRTVQCNDVIQDDNTGSNSYTTDRHNNYHQYSPCIEFLNGNNQPYYPQFRSKEVHYVYDNNFQPRPITIDVALGEPQNNQFDLDVFLFGGCNNNRLNNCIDVNGHLPPRLNESLFLDAVRSASEDDIHIIVDGQSFTSPSYRVNEGDYTFAITCGPISGVNGSTVVTPIQCNSPINDNNGLGVNRASYYSCDEENDRGNNWGPERVYSFTLTQTTLVDIDLDILGNADLSLYLTSDLNSQSCLDKSKTIGVGVDESISLTLQAGSYYIVVDGYQGSIGDYTLHLSGCGSSKVCKFIPGRECGSVGDVVSIPVSVETFENVESFGFDFKLPSGGAVSIVGLDNIRTGYTNISGNKINNYTYRLAWDTPDGQLKTLADGTRIFDLQVRIDSPFNQDITISGDNMDFISGTVNDALVIQGKVCFNNSIDLSGKIVNRQNFPRAGVEVTLDGPIQLSTLSDASGNYEFNQIPAGNYTISCFDNRELPRGVNGADATLVRAHFLQKKLITDPYKMIAGNVIRDDKLSNSDAGRIRRIFFRTVNDLPNNSSWRFVPKSRNLNGQAFSIDISEPIMVNATQSQNDLDFYVMKSGDVNDNSLPRPNESNFRNNTDLILTMEADSIVTGESFEIRLNAEKFEDIVSMGFVMKWDQGKLKLNDLGAFTLPGFDESSYQLGDSVLYVSWEEPNLNAVKMDDGTIGVFNFIAKHHTEALNVSISDIYIVDDEFNEFSHEDIDVQIGISGTKEFDHALDVVVSPNPFTNYLDLNMNVSYNTNLKIFDMKGRVLYDQMIDNDSNRIDFGTITDQKGIFVLRFESKDGVTHEKVLRM